MSGFNEGVEAYVEAIKAGDMADGIIMDRLRELEIRGAYTAGYKAALEYSRGLFVGQNKVVE